MSDDKARDILGELHARVVLGADLTDRVGKRAWTRPRVSISPRLFLQYRVGDPWDPASEESSAPIGLGPVSLRLGEKRRQPAPHLKPKEAKKPKAQAASPPPQPRVPEADPIRSEPKPRASAEDGETARLAAAAAEKRRQAEAARAWPRRKSSSKDEAPTKADGSRGPALAPLPVRPEAREAAAASRPASDAGESRQEPGGRFRMKAALRTSAPVVREVTEPSSSDDSPSDAPDVATPPRPRAAPAGAVSGGLDDLFSAAAHAGRMRVPQRPDEAGEE